MKRETFEQEYSELGFSNKFMFGRIMRDADRAKPFLEEILGIKIHHIEYVDREKDMDVNPDSHGIRMDLYVDDGKTIYNCEMQSRNDGNLRKRSRYYQGIIDAYNLESGDDYDNLKKTFIIFICTFDLFGEDRYIYKFESRCEDNPELKLNDGAVKVFINTKGSIGNVSDSFRELMHFIDTSDIKEYKSDLVNNLKDALVDARKRKDWRDSYMTMKEYFRQVQRETREETQEEDLYKYISRMKKLGVEEGNIIEAIMEDFEYSREKAEESVHKLLLQPQQ
ncbi:MAG: Rpn family recombination-promoting nuclease/putative transposase [Lachnospiraceae bacterium]|nr:Rpn family recombination-promoting nuclease/putative transposase [Lachnospiraceae bacterium]